MYHNCFTFKVICVSCLRFSPHNLYRHLSTKSFHYKTNKEKQNIRACWFLLFKTVFVFKNKKQENLFGNSNFWKLFSITIYYNLKKKIRTSLSNFRFLPLMLFLTVTSFPTSTIYSIKNSFWNLFYKTVLEN